MLSVLFAFRISLGMKKAGLWWDPWRYLDNSRLLCTHLQILLNFRKNLTFSHQYLLCDCLVRSYLKEMPIITFLISSDSNWKRKWGVEWSRAVLREIPQVNKRWKESGKSPTMPTVLSIHSVCHYHGSIPRILFLDYLRCCIEIIQLQWYNNHMAGGVSWFSIIPTQINVKNAYFCLDYYPQFEVGPNLKYSWNVQMKIFQRYSENWVKSEGGCISDHYFLPGALRRPTFARGL
jgi:hypothetical protein